MAFNSIFYSFIISLFFLGCDDNSSTQDAEKTEVNAALVILDPNKGLVYHNDIPFTGKSVTYYPNSENKSKSIEYTEGKKQGIYLKWYLDGKLSYQANYSNGKKEGFSKTWWKNGSLRSKSHFQLGKLDGKQEQWYLSGAKFKELHFLNGQEQGMQKAWRENGKIYNNYEAKEGRIYGLKRANLCYQLADETIVYESYEDFNEIQD